jgi:5-deoxy-glucuronate isomerase
VQYTADNILIRSQTTGADTDLIASVTPERAAWQYITFQARRLGAGRSWSFENGERECALVDLCGSFSVRSNRGSWQRVGGRVDVFRGAGSVLYLPRRTQVEVTADGHCEFAVAWAPTDEDREPFLVKPAAVPVSIRGGDNVSRQINDLLPPGSPVHRLVLVEVYTPGGNWSSYPPHKHDVHIENPDGSLREADLEEIYFYKFDRPEGYAYQRVYTDERSPLHRAGTPIDALVRPENNSVVLVPEGYHPVVGAPGYTTYYLNVLAGSAQSLANQDDPKYTWVKQTYRTRDERLPLY